jgi:hypothetical protein
VAPHYAGIEVSKLQQTGTPARVSELFSYFSMISLCSHVSPYSHPNIFKIDQSVYTTAHVMSQYLGSCVDFDGEATINYRYAGLV